MKMEVNTNTLWIFVKKRKYKQILAFDYYAFPHFLKIYNCWQVIRFTDINA